MPVQWAGFGPELLLTIDRDSAAGLRAQIGLRMLAHVVADIADRIVTE
jgi:hypothetical protein